MLLIMPDEAGLAVEMIKLGFRKAIILSEIPSLSSSAFDCLKNEAGLSGNGYDEKRLRRLKKVNRVFVDDNLKKHGSLFLYVYLIMASNPKNKMNIEELVSAYSSYRELYNVHCNSYNDTLKSEMIDANMAWQIATAYRSDLIDLVGCFYCRNKYMYLTCNADTVCNMKCAFCGKSHY